TEIEGVSESAPVHYEGRHAFVITDELPESVHQPMDVFGRRWRFRVDVAHELWRGHGLTRMASQLRHDRQLLRRQVHICTINRYEARPRVEVERSRRRHGSLTCESRNLQRPRQLGRV